MSNYAHSEKLINQHENFLHDENISNCARQIEKYRQRCLENSRQRREQELMQLRKAHERSRILYEELVASALRKTDFLEQSDLNFTPALAGVSHLYSQSSADILLQQLKQRAHFQKKWERHVQRQKQKPSSTTGHIIANKHSATSQKPAVATDQVVIPETASTSSQVISQKVDWHAISAHTLPKISKMRCQSAGATVCFVCRRMAPRRTRTRARNDLASLIQRNNIIKLRYRLDVSRPSYRSPLGVMLPRNRRLGVHQARDPTAKRKQNRTNSLPSRKQKRKRQSRRARPDPDTSGRVGSTTPSKPQTVAGGHGADKRVGVGTDSLLSVSSRSTVRGQLSVPVSAEPEATASESDTISRLFLGLAHPPRPQPDTPARSSMSNAHLWGQVIASYSRLTGLGADERGADQEINHSSWSAYHSSWSAYHSSWSAYHSGSPDGEGAIVTVPPSSPTQFLLQIDAVHSVD